MAVEILTQESLIEPVKPVPYATLGSLTLDGALRPIEAIDDAVVGYTTKVESTPGGGLDIEDA